MNKLKNSYCLTNTEFNYCKTFADEIINICDYCIAKIKSDYNLGNKEKAAFIKYPSLILANLTFQSNYLYCNNYLNTLLYFEFSLENKSDLDQFDNRINVMKTILKPLGLIISSTEIESTSFYNKENKVIKKILSITYPKVNKIIKQRDKIINNLRKKLIKS